MKAMAAGVARTPRANAAAFGLGLVARASGCHEPLVNRVPAITRIGSPVAARSCGAKTTTVATATAAHERTRPHTTAEKSRGGGVPARVGDARGAVSVVCANFARISHADSAGPGPACLALLTGEGVHPALAYVRARARTVPCPPDLTADHIVPLSLGGHPLGPLRVLCRRGNSQRGVKLDWQGDQPRHSRRW
jgi:hypothetical protein